MAKKGGVRAVSFAYFSLAAKKSKVSWNAGRIEERNPIKEDVGFRRAQSDLRTTRFIPFISWPNSEYTALMPPPQTPSPDEYRRRVNAAGLVSYRVVVEQTDLFIRTGKDLSTSALDLVHDARDRIEAWAERRPEFFTSMTPLPLDHTAPPPVRRMLAAGKAAGVGPMAAVAGAVAEYVGRGLLEKSPHGVVVENGGDVFLSVPDEVVVGLFAGASAMSMKFGLKFSPDRMPTGICTSSGSIGHSFSMGRADAATVVGESSALADAVATALGNRVTEPDDIEPALEWTLSIPGVIGASVVIGDRIGLLGDLEIVPL